jgi:tetratricopeptide (TPR) repeat protein
MRLSNFRDKTTRLAIYILSPSPYNHLISHSSLSYPIPFTQDDRNQVLDVIQTGLKAFSGPDAGRLLLAQADIESQNYKWADVIDLAHRALHSIDRCDIASQSTQPQHQHQPTITTTTTTTHSAGNTALQGEVSLTACTTLTRSYLTLGRDAEAFEAAQKCMTIARDSFTAVGEEDRRWRGLVLATSIAGTVQHAAGDIDAARESFDAVTALANHEDLRSGPGMKRDCLVGEALKQAAALRLADGQPQEAAALVARASAAIADKLKTSLTESASVDRSPIALNEAAADAYLLAAQIQMDLKEFGAAEGPLESAVSAAEEAGGGTRLVPILLLLATVYSRTGRATLAEGLYRECCKLVGLSTAVLNESGIGMQGGAGGGGVRGGVSSSSLSSSSSSSLKSTTTTTTTTTSSGGTLTLPPAAQAVHPSLLSLLAWRYSQLLAALPRRDTETAGWQAVARALWDDSPVSLAASPETVFGKVEALKGQGDWGLGVVVDLMTRRALPRRIGSAS